MTYTEPPRAPTPSGLVGLIGVVALLTGLLFTIAWCHGCGPRPTEPGITEAATRSAIAVEYKLRMGDCRKKAVAAKDIGVFDKCADEVDSWFCQSKGLRCDGGAP